MADQQISTGDTSGASDGASYVQSLGSAGMSLGDDFGDISDAEETGGDSQATSLEESAAAVDPPAGNEDVTAEAEADATATPEANADPIAQLAAELGLDPNNPAHRKTLDKVLAKQQELDKLGTAPQQEDAGDDGDALTEYERSLLAEEKPATTDTAKPGQAAAAEPGKLGDVGDAWTGPNDAWVALSRAYEAVDPEKPETFQKVTDIQNAIFMRQFLAASKVREQEMRDFMEKEYGEVTRHVSQQRQQMKAEQNRQTAIEGLAKDPKFADVTKLWEPIDDKMIKFNGKEYPNTPLNRVLKSNPELLNIRYPHADPDKADQLSKAAMFKQVHRIWKQSQKPPAISPEKAKDFVKAGADIQKNAQTSRTKQALNSGNGATGSGAATTPKNYIKEILADKTAGGMLSLSDL